MALMVRFYWSSRLAYLLLACSPSILTVSGSLASSVSAEERGGGRDKGRSGNVGVELRFFPEHAETSAENSALELRRRVTLRMKPF